MGGLRALQRGTRIIGVDVPVNQRNILIVDAFREARESWKGQEYVCFPAMGGFGKLIPEADMFEHFRQVHPAEMDRIPWERSKFSLEEPEADIPTMYDGLNRGGGWNGWAEPWLTHETLVKIRDLWHEEHLKFAAKHGEDVIQDLHTFLFDEKFGWMHWSGNLDSMEFLVRTVAEVDGEKLTVWNAQCGLTWDAWTDEEIAELHAQVKGDD
jgi:hypothetical protein